jgi:hypothetical protein
MQRLEMLPAVDFESESSHFCSVAMRSGSHVKEPVRLLRNGGRWERLAAYYLTIAELLGSEGGAA